MLFAPRIGLAYRPTETLVIRTGFSLNYQQDSMITNTGTYAYPEEVTVGFPGANTYSPSPTTFATGYNPFPSINLSSGTIPLYPVPGHIQCRKTTCAAISCRGTLPCRSHS